MAQVNIAELATEGISLSDFFAKANTAGVASKNTIQNLMTLFETVGEVGFKGSISAGTYATHPAGWYFATNTGDYIMGATTIPVDVSDTLTIIIVPTVINDSSKVEVPLSFTIDATVQEGSPNPVAGGGVKTYIDTFDLTIKKVIGTNSDMTGANDWIAAIGTPSFDINTTVSDKMFIDFTTGNQEVKLSNLLTVNEIYQVRLKARLNSGLAMPIRIGAFVTTITNMNAFDVAPTSVEQEFVGYIKASEVDFSIGCVLANNIGSNIEITDVKVILLSEESKLIFNSIGNSVIVYGANPDGVTDNTATIQSLIDNTTSSTLNLFFPNGEYLIGELIIDGFLDVNIYGDNAKIKAKSGFTTIFNITNGERLTVNNLFCNINSNNLTDGFFKVEDFKDYAKFDKVDFKNFAHNTAYACKFERVGNDSSITGQETGIGVSFNHCNFYNNQVISLPTFNYSTSTWKGRGIWLGNDCEYWRVVNCYFRCIHVGIETADGANGTISASNFSYCNSYDFSTSTSRGVVNILNTADNNGKLLINSCHFNHNYGVSIKSVYNNTGRPMHIVNNQFIANAYTAIQISSQWGNIINSNFFDRAALHVGLPSDPFTANDSNYILLTDSSRNAIKMNIFKTGVELAFVKSVGTSDYNVLSENNHTLSSSLFDSVGINNVLRNNDNFA